MSGKSSLTKTLQAAAVSAGLMLAIASAITLALAVIGIIVAAAFAACTAIVLLVIIGACGFSVPGIIAVAINMIMPVVASALVCAVGITAAAIVVSGVVGVLYAVHSWKNSLTPNPFCLNFFDPLNKKMKITNKKIEKNRELSGLWINKFFREHPFGDFFDQ